MKQGADVPMGDVMRKVWNALMGLGRVLVALGFIAASGLVREADSADTFRATCLIGGLLLLGQERRDTLPKERR